MSKKYVIEIKPEYEDSFQGVMLLGAKDSTLYVDTLSIDDLEVLNSDYINEHYGSLQSDAYQRGYEDGAKSVENWNNEEKKLRLDEAFDRGLTDAWEAARKIVVDTDHGGLALGTLSEIFGTQSCSYIMRENTAQEAIDKIKSYEDKQTDRIEVGDEVVWNNGTTLTVTRLHKLDDDEWCDCMDENGAMYGVLKDNVRKTGRHYDVKSILEAMQDVTER